jgi:hypothetical protein
VRLDLAADALATAFAGQTQIDRAQGQAGGAVILRAQKGWIDRVVLQAMLELNVRRFCYDSGPFGWQRYEQWA